MIELDLDLLSFPSLSFFSTPSLLFLTLPLPLLFWIHKWTLLVSQLHFLLFSLLGSWLFDEDPVVQACCSVLWAFRLFSQGRRWCLAFVGYYLIHILNCIIYLCNILLVY